MDDLLKVSQNQQTSGRRKRSGSLRAAPLPFTSTTRSTTRSDNEMGEGSGKAISSTGSNVNSKSRGYFSESVLASVDGQRDGQRVEGEEKKKMKMHQSPRRLPSLRVSSSTDDILSSSTRSQDENEVNEIDVEKKDDEMKQRDVEEVDPDLIVGKIQLKNEPKVMAPFQNEPGFTPRKIKIERLKREYEIQDIEHLLYLEGIDSQTNTLILGSRPSRQRDTNGVGGHQRDGTKSTSRGNGVVKRFGSKLPLEYFDNENFECRMPSEWVEMVSELDDMKGVPGKCLYKSSLSRGADDPSRGSDWLWRKCYLVDYSDKKGQFLIRWIDQQDSQHDQRDSQHVENDSDLHWTPRIYLVFDSEDPFVFAKRFSSAHKLRKITESFIRYNTYIDCMPMDDKPQRDEVVRILSNALQSREKKLRSLGNKTASHSAISLRDGNKMDNLVNEVESVYGRAMNKIIFDENLSCIPRLKDHPMFSSLENIPTSQDITDPLSLAQQQDQQDRQRDVQRDGEAGTRSPLDNGLLQRDGKPPQRDRTRPNGVWNIAEYSNEMYLENQNKFRFSSYLPRVEIIEALTKVRTDCNRMVALNLFTASRITKSVRLAEFEQIQSQVYTQESTFLKESLLLSFKNGIKMSLKDVGKGWFNLRENRMELYEVSKLKKFMNVVKFMMEDSLRYLVENSLEDFVHMIEVAASSRVYVNGINDVRVSKTLDQKRFPLFMIDFGVINKHEIGYKTDLAVHEEKLISLCNSAISSLQNVPSLEREIMENLIWTHTPILASVHMMEDKVQNMYQRVKYAMERSTKPLVKYHKMYEGYNTLVQLDVEQYSREFRERKPSEDEIKDEIRFQLVEHDRIENEIPTSISAGMFFINTFEVRNFLCQKRKILAEEALTYLMEKTRKLAEKLGNEFSSISRKVLAGTKNIEELTQQKNYINTVPRLCKQLKRKVDKMNTRYETIEKFNFPIPQDDFDSKWAIMGWTKLIFGQFEDTLTVHERTRKRYEKDLQASKETFGTTYKELAQDVNVFTVQKDMSRTDELYEMSRTLDKRLKDAKVFVHLVQSRERLFGFEETGYHEVNTLVNEFQPFIDLWQTAFDWRKWQKSWELDPFINIDPDDLEKDIKDAWRKIFKVTSLFKNKGDVFEIAEGLKVEIEKFEPQLPLITALRNPGMRKRHWAALSKNLELQSHFEPDENFTLSDLNKMNLQDELTKIRVVCDTAGKEYIIESTLDRMEKEWLDMEFTVVHYKDTGTHILKASDEITQLLDDHLVTTQSMSFSAYKKVFEKRIATWEKKLTLIADILDSWLQVQKQWLYLEPIFSSDDIHRQMPTEGKRFSTMDRHWRAIMSKAFLSPNIFEVCGTGKILTTFLECNKLLELVQKGLSEYLETKCAAFPRFYFLSNDELLQILSQTKDPTAVQPHLHKCFENISQLEFQDDLEITSMQSGEGEVITLTKPLYPKGNVEHWILDVENSMIKTIHDVIEKGLASYDSIPRTQWVLENPGQVVLAASIVNWTKEVSEAIRTGSLQQQYDRQLEQLDGLTHLVRGDLPDIARNILGSLIVMDVHARDVTKKLLKVGVTNERDYEWMSQLRYYWDGTDVHVRIVSSTFRYGYEYLGNTGRLVITPLTDRCYVTLTGALHMQLGGAPQGPAGTGKTETTKDLAKALAKQCVVFNCSDGLDHLAMEKFFKGLASSGAWSCFDEFNRIELEVLSVIAQQIMSIQRAIQLKLKRFNFAGMDITLDSSCAVFITMNPGYAGRSELPDNLKALFRPVAMMVPDYAMIAEIMLFSFGFTDAFSLARKMVATFRLSSEQLSSQDHYDFGMRAVKTVISAAGNIKRRDPNLNEELILLRALQDVNLPKFLAEDIPLFNGIINDLFPETEQTKFDYGKLEVALKESVEELNLQPDPFFLTKCIQLYETTVVRHGLMLVGPTGGGKTTCYKVLQKAFCKLSEAGEPGFAPVETYVMNPKSITMGQLYGEFEEATHEWTDGVLARIVRETSGQYKPDVFKWVIFDGPVDAVWIENMNTVLDDNKKLCLNNGEIITLTDKQIMMFEVEDLAVASPATVSRCGMVYLEPFGITPLLQTWLSKLPKSMEEDTVVIQTLIDQFITPAVKFVRKEMKEPVPTVDCNLAHSFMNILDCFFTKYQNDDLDEEEDEEPSLEKLRAKFPENFNTVIQYHFFFALVWSVGGTSDSAGRLKFDEWLRTRMSEFEYNTVRFPPEGLVYDYHFNDSKWCGWMDDQPQFQITPNTPYHEIMVPTIDTVRYDFLLDLLLGGGKHVLCFGPTGIGKSVVIMEMLTKKMDPDITPIFMNFSATTSANMTQDIFEGKLEKRRKGVFGPPAGRRFVVFIDDLNMPQKEKYGAQPPIELLRQWFNNGGWYDRKTLDFLNIIDINFVAAMGPPGGGRNVITQRFTRHFNLISFVEMGNDTLQFMFHTILSNYLAQFKTELRELARPMVDATVDIYNTIAQELRPTPNKSHYTFNLRDLSKVFQGMYTVSKSSIKEPINLVRLWCHECTRVFQDRLVEENDTKWFQDLLEAKMFTYLHYNMTDVVIAERLVYGDFMVQGQKEYEEISDMNSLTSVMNEHLRFYNGIAEKEMKLVLFLKAIEHVARITRVLRQPLGHALLLGLGGSGKQSLTKLAAHIVQYDLFQIEISSTYGIAEWREDLKSVILKAGLEEKKIVFLFSDTQIVHPSFLEDVNNLLNTGDVPNIFGLEEMENIANTISPIVQAMGLSVHKEIIYSHFLKRVQQNLHITICMSPIGEEFRSTLRQYPSLVNCCTIDWFKPWPQEALVSVANKFLQAHDDNVRTKLVEMCMYMHQSMEVLSRKYKEEFNRIVYVTATSYLELIQNFEKFMEAKKLELGTLRKRLKIGLDKLEETAEQVEVLQAELKTNKPLLEAANKETEATMEQIVKDKAQADETRKVVVKEEEEANKMADETKAIADDAQRDLQEALPALRSAEQALKTLNKRDISEVKSMVRPPSGVRLVMEAVCIILGVKPSKVPGTKPGEKAEDYWDQSRLLLNEPKFLENLVSFDKDSMEESTIKKLQPYIESNDFRPFVIAKVSKAATSLCLWVRAIEKYYHVAKAVAPKRAALKEAQLSLEKTLAALNNAKKKLGTVEERIAQLEVNFNESQAKKELLERKVRDCEEKMNRAVMLVDSLADEKDRWIEKCQDIEQQLENLIGDALIAAGVIAYLGPFRPTYRSGMLRNWRHKLAKVDIPHTQNCTLFGTLGDPVKLRQEHIHGLPTDSHSIENSVVVQHSSRWPLFIDPQGQANKWIKRMEADNGLDVIKLTTQGFLRTLENAIRFGKPVILENVGEELDAVLDPLLLKQVYKQGGNEMIKIGDNVIQYHDGFRFYITTKLPNPHYKPEISTKVTVIDFTLTPQGLEDQLLGLVVEKERPDLQEQKEQLVISNAQMKKDIKEIEEKILVMLATHKGSPLDDDSLITVLGQSKKASKQIKQKVAESEENERDIDMTRSLYQPVAVRATVLFFCIVDLSQIDHMYQFSLNWFLNLFVLGISNAEPSKILDERLKNLNSYFTYSLFRNVCRSLFEKHKLLFGFLLCAKILENHDELDAQEWRYLLAGDVPSFQKDPETADIPKPDWEWLTNKIWDDLIQLSHLPRFQGFLESLVESKEIFKRYWDSTNPEDFVWFPPPWDNLLSKFQRLLVLRCFRPEKLIPAIQQFISANMGAQFIDPVSFDLRLSFKDSFVNTPLIFILSPGADPNDDFFKFAEEMKFGKKTDFISLGQGQGPRAEKMLLSAMERGTWVLLQNCHLAESWMPQLEKIVEGIRPEKVHRDFRLWLTSMPSKHFPVSVLQDGIKMTNEPPKGLKANLLRTYQSIPEEFFQISTKGNFWRKLMFGLNFFHALIQERRKFGGLGWNIRYEFNNSDLSICQRQLKMFLEEYEDIPFKLLQYLAGDINYGGRVTDDWDRRTLKNILSDFYTPEIFESEYKFSTSGMYYAPDCDKLRDFMKYCMELPINDPPEVFGLHENANITSAQQETFSMLETLLSLQPRVTRGPGKPRDQQIADVARDILRRVPEKLVGSETGDKTEEELYSDSFIVVLSQEIMRYNRLLLLIDVSCKELLKALAGEIVMSADLDAVANSLYDNQVPQYWESRSYPSLKPLQSWITDLEARLDMLTKWQENGKPPAVFWISGFFFPQAFLTGTLQNFARQKHIPVDTISFDCHIMEKSHSEITEPPEHGVYIHGLYLEGARWNTETKSIDDSIPKELYVKMPVMWLEPVVNRIKSKTGFYSCPTYKILSRAGTLSTTGHSTNFIRAFEIPSNKPEKYWIKRGVALICSLNY